MNELAGLILIKRVESATGPDRELDARIAAVDGLVFCWCGVDGSWCSDHLPSAGGCGKPLGLADERHSYPFQWQDDGRLPAYTASVDAALALVERKLPGWRISIDQMKAGWDADLSEPGNRSGVFNATAPLPALAILLALLRALAHREPTNGR